MNINTPHFNTILESVNSTLNEAKKSYSSKKMKMTKAVKKKVRAKSK